MKDRTQYLKDYYLKNKDKIKERNSVNYKIKKEKISERTSKYYSDNKDKYKSYRILNKEKSDLYYKNYYHSVKINRNYLNKYKISLEDYNDLFNKQNGSCAGCKRHQSEFSKRFAIDHCHKTNKIRGLLCMQCNLTLGMINDNTDVLSNLINYLKNEQQSYSVKD